MFEGTTPNYLEDHVMGEPILAHHYLGVRKDIDAGLTGTEIRVKHQIGTTTLQLIRQAGSYMQYLELRAQKSNWRKGIKRSVVKVRAVKLPTRKPGLIARLFRRA